jgi:membrane protease YdiL (CAAX protease family)
MEKTFKKHETLFTIALIVIYVVMNSYMMQNFGYTSIQSAVANTILSVLIIGFIIAIKKVKYYGLVKANNPKKFLYFIPLFVISLYNLRNSINTNNPTNEIIYFVITMINVGFLEEIIFRGFLFKMMEKDNAKRAIIVSSITFGLGHIVNLLNGADFLSTLLQVIYAIAIGYMLVMVFYKSKSLQSGLNSFDIILKTKSLLSTSKNDINNTNNKTSNKKNKKILKYPLNKDIFSKSLLSKKNYLDSIYEKELNFQKKLLELKGYDMQKYSDSFNAQKVINSAEKNFEILNCFAESKNTKKNLINLVKDINEFQVLQNMFPFKKLRDRSQKLNLVNLKNFMLMHHIRTNKPNRFDPNNVTKNNEEKSKILSMECAKLEQLEKKNKEQRKTLMNFWVKKRSKSKKKFY